jgi:hypothetical protein
MSATDGVCGSADGRGILFDREVPPVEKMLASFVLVSSCCYRTADDDRDEWREKSVTI